MKVHFSFFASVACLSLLAGCAQLECSSNGPAAAAGAHTRVFNAYNSLPNLTVDAPDGSSFALGLGLESSYRSTPVGERTLRAAQVDGPVLHESQRMISPDDQTTYVLYPALDPANPRTLAGLGALELNDKRSKPADSTYSVRIGHMSRNLGTVDVYVAREDVTSPRNGGETLVAANVNFTQTVEITGPAGQYRILFRSLGNTVVSNPIEFRGGLRKSVFFFDNREGLIQQAEFLDELNQN